MQRIMQITLQAMIFPTLATLATLIIRAYRVSGVSPSAPSCRMIGEFVVNCRIERMGLNRRRMTR